MGTVLRFYIPIHKVLEWLWRHFTSLNLCKCSQIPHPELHQTPVAQKATIIDLIIYEHSTQIKLRHLARDRSGRQLSNPFAFVMPAFAPNWNGWKIGRTNDFIVICIFFRTITFIIKYKPDIVFSVFFSLDQNLMKLEKRL